MSGPASFGAIVALSILAGLCVGSSCTWVDRARERRRRARRAAVSWEYYSRPGVGFGLWEVGVERVFDTEVLEHQRTANLSPWDFRSILDAEGEAIALAWRYNDAQGVRP